MVGVKLRKTAEALKAKPSSIKAKIKAWSFSRYTCYSTCPAQAKYKFIDKLKEPSSPAMERGSAIHALCDDYITGKINSLPPELKLFSSEFKARRAQFKKSPISNPTISVEGEWAFRADWTPTFWKDWDGAWVRIKTDLTHFEAPTVAIVTDWKSGKPRDEKIEEYIQQLDLYAPGVMMTYPRKGLVVRPRIGFLDTGEWYDADEREYSINELPALQKAWEKRTKPMLNDTVFAPKPGNHCRWCSFSKSKNGPCKF